jgi:glycerol-3-phosphate acyltransferase PlsY
VDVRTIGSHNIGATNVARNLGLKWGILVLMMDMAKGAVPVLVALHIWPAEAKVGSMRIAVVALAAFLGHLSSPFLRFRGGKGVATAFGIALVLFPKAALPSFLVFFLVTWLWRYVSFGSIMAISTLPIFAVILGYSPIYFGLAMVVVLFVVGRHRANIRDLLKGQERKL